MIRFRLEDENNKDENGNFKSYTIDLDFKNGEDIGDWCCDEDSGFEIFMDKMECGSDPWCGVHDGGGSEDPDGVYVEEYMSYEIEDFDTAIKLWEDYFRSKGKLDLKRKEKLEEIEKNIKN